MTKMNQDFEVDLSKQYLRHAEYRKTTEYEDSVKVDRGPVETVELTMGLTQDLCYRVDAMVSRLIGSAGEGSNGEAGKALAPSGIFPNLQSRAESTAATVQWANSALDRLERHLL